MVLFVRDYHTSMEGGDHDHDTCRGSFDGGVRAPRGAEVGKV